ncbi:MAG: ATP-binding protein [Candidatus Ratteibacteria bacterium]|nr:ATP-binding protein [Candidatus Ratteibacteria bacterium]
MAGNESYIEIEKKPGVLEYISDFIQEKSLGIKLGFKKTWELMLVVDEICSNILSNSPSDSFLKIIWKSDDNCVKVEIIDKGWPYNPLESPSDEDEMCSLGAMGTYMIEKMVDSVDYQRIRDINKVSLTKYRRQKNNHMKSNGKGDKTNGKRVPHYPGSP